MNFILRNWNSDDLSSLVKYANNYNIAKNLTNLFPYPYTIEHGKVFIEKANSSNAHLILAIDINGEAIGGIGLHPQTDIHIKNAELGYWLAEPFWGNGIITSAIKQIVEKGFMELDIERIFARPFGTNIGSQKVLEKAGFNLEARLEKTILKNGEYLDELIYAVRKN
ncbi:MAG: GNAT family N-acetyltransferase [Bacteroidetes bacterium]|nr:GNAT family N-acetyltransferase [Bacteroidota bacterium]